MGILPKVSKIQSKISVNESFIIVNRFKQSNKFIRKKLKLNNGELRMHLKASIKIGQKSHHLKRK